ncbi:hypothetical protein [Phytoactinopolyspora mesophila]|uniref:Uncharacterized protein n=1 Tax=Phytoactinopolyspora mesophila TaxID=2650750 RepID=A0A7K3MDA7_9ACTN|nr:hypothetical protein [Phytoactinopolyspora mesophila]NDL60388.1 hypothetical protein [Phytoactinopolyspora mesophila]
MHPFTSEVWAAERRRELTAEAAEHRLAASGTRRTGVLARAAERLRSAWAAPTPSRDTICCSPA